MNELKTLLDRQLDINLTEEEFKKIRDKDKLLKALKNPSISIEFCWKLTYSVQIMDETCGGAESYAEHTEFRDMDYINTEFTGDWQEIEE